MCSRIQNANIIKPATPNSQAKCGTFSPLRLWLWLWLWVRLICMFYCVLCLFVWLSVAHKNKPNLSQCSQTMGTNCMGAGALTSYSYFANACNTQLGRRLCRLPLTFIACNWNFMATKLAQNYIRPLNECSLLPAGHKSLRSIKTHSYWVIKRRLIGPLRGRLYRNCN